MAFEFQPPSLKTDTTSNGNASDEVILQAAAAGVKNRVFVEHVSMTNAGYLYFRSGASGQISQRFYFNTRGMYPVFQWFEATNVAEALYMVAEWDSNSDGTFRYEASYRTDPLRSTPG